MFTADTFRFLDDLAANNERPWFDANKARYERVVREPALAFVRAMRPCLADLAPRFVADDKKAGGSLMRIFRDTRFSSDKTPYKTNVGVQFRHEGGADVHAPGIYVHVAPDECFVGIGSWSPEPPVLEAIRRAIVADPDAYRGATKIAGWSTDGGAHGTDRLKRPPKGFPPDHPLVEELKKKSHLASRPLTRDDVVDAHFVDHLADHLASAVPYLRWLTEASGAPF